LIKVLRKAIYIYLWRKLNFINVKKLFLLVFLTSFSFGIFAQTVHIQNNATSIFLKKNNWVDVLHGKPINYYLSNQNVDALSKKAFLGNLDISKECNFTVLFDSLLACKSDCRPFYFYIFNELVERSDDRLTERVSEMCTQFVRQYPCEFFSYFDEPEITINAVKWTTYIGGNLKDKNNYIEFKNSVDLKLKTVCPNLLDLWKSFQNEVRMCLGR